VSVEFEVDADGVALITMNRPERMNAMDLEAYRQLSEAWSRVRDDPEIRVAVITGADSGIGRAVAIAYAREGADVVISYLSEDADAQETAGYVEQAGRRAVLVAGDVSEAAHCREIVDRAVAELGRIDILVNNAAFQMSHDDILEVSDEEWDYTFATNVSAMFHLVKAALPHMRAGSSIIGSVALRAAPAHRRTASGAPVVSQPKSR